MSSNHVVCRRNVSLQTCLVPFPALLAVGVVVAVVDVVVTVVVVAVVVVAVVAVIAVAVAVVIAVVVTNCSAPTQPKQRTSQVRSSRP